MIYCVWLPLLAPLFAVPALRFSVRRLPPRRAAWVLVGCSTVLACCSTAALGALAALGLLQIKAVAALAHFTPRQLNGYATPALWVAPLAVALLLAALAQSTRVVGRHHREVRAQRRATGPTAGELSVRRDENPYAYALPGRRGRPGHIVVSDAMLRVLRPAEREALFAHERAHLTGRHHRFLAAGQLAAVHHPVLLGLREPLAYALERWADEAAARAVGDRQLAARAIGRAALAAHEANGPAVSRGAMLATAGGAVPRRVKALLETDAAQPQGQRLRRLCVIAALLCCMAATVATAADAVEDLHLDVRLAQGRPAAP
ncbi:M56 family metallopeptidase [Streptomyces sp. NPDC050560]|uniref:M56 family metallopeptidase n=1 Tax=Streptomyces sp. NPDC050560 TaxID=3365630 RepID=UPI0037946E39